jgi:hypothetical protein
VHVRLHDDRVQSGINTAARLEQGGEQRAGAHLGDPHGHIAGGGGDDPLAVAIALGGAGLAAFVAASADVGGRLGVDQPLQRGLQQVRTIWPPSPARSASTKPSRADWSRVIVRSPSLSLLWSDAQSYTR